MAHVNGYTQPSLNDLHSLIVSHGGGFLQYLDGKTTVTHIIASSLTPKKVVEFKRYRIVKPAWIVDSVQAGKLQPWDRYRVVDEGFGQKLLQVDGSGLSSQLNTKPLGYRDQTDTSWYTTKLREHDAILAEEGQQHQDDMEDLAQRTDLDVNKADGDFGLSDDEFSSLQEAHLASARDPDITEGHLPVQDPVESDVQRINDDHLIERQTTSLRVQQAEEIETIKRKSLSPPASPPSNKKQKLTAEEHNALLLADPRIRKSSTLNPDFLEQYYRESRLHHLSAWKAELKSQLQAMTAEKSPSQQKQTLKRPPGARRYILHVDFDSFFVAVSLKSCPQYKDKPVVVAHGGGSGSEIASCNYPARKYGVKNGMWMKKAQEMCKDLIVLPYDFPAYEAASKLFYAAILASGGVVQSVSIDEALIDITALCLPTGGQGATNIGINSILDEQTKADEIATGLRDEVRAGTGCEVSVGIGGNILLAKVALRKAKPAGQHQIKPEEVLDFLADLEVESLPGVAYSIGGKLQELGIKFVKDIRDFSKERLMAVLGPKTGEKIWSYAKGMDRVEVGDQVVRKSVSAEVNWGVRFETNDQAEEFVESLCIELSRRLLKERVRGKQMTMKIMRRAADAPLDPPKHLGHGKCDTFNKSVVLGVATNAKEILAKEALSILRSYGFSPGELRGLGVQMQKLEPLRSAANASEIESSQRRLQFKTGQITEPPKAEVEDPIEEVETPMKSRLAQYGIAAGALASSNSPTRKPLNIMGTQFILPTQVDPSVLAELPADIKAKLAKITRPAREGVPTSLRDTVRSKNAEEIKKENNVGFPNQSQLDPEILEALPEDVRAEILAQYDTSPSKNRSTGAQSLLPQSPRKIRTLPPARRGVATRGRRGGTTLLSRLKAVSKETTTLTQSNFVARSSRGNSHDPFAADGDADSDAPHAEISSDFLDALPDNLKREVLEAHKREQLKRTGGIEVSRRRKLAKGQDAGAGAFAQRERVLVLPAKPERPTFTMQKLSSLLDLREAVSAWHDEFRAEGPYAEDVDALGRYLGSVVTEERDMAKAVSVIKWLEWVVEEDGRGATTKWTKAIDAAKLCVSTAVQERQLGPLDF